MGTVNVITGAAGLVGSHIAEELCRRGATVRALVRPTTDTTFLRTLPLEIEAVDLDDLRRYPQALASAGVVYHCAAFVRDWGTWDEFRAGTVDTTRNVVRACRDVGVDRFVHISSISVYGNPPESAGQITEDSPIGQYLWSNDYYGKAKLLAEDEARRHEQWVIVRPSWIYGLRDHVSIPRVVEALRIRRATIIGRGDNLLNLVNAADVARGIVMAAESPNAVGQAYHLCSPGEITQREFFDFLSDQLGLPRVTRQVPFRAAWRVAQMLEFLFRATGRRAAPAVTRRALLMLSRPTRFSIAKAERELGWRPEVPARAGLEQALRYYCDTEAESETCVADSH